MTHQLLIVRPDGSVELSCDDASSLDGSAIHEQKLPEQKLLKQKPKPVTQIVVLKRSNSQSSLSSLSDISEFNMGAVPLDTQHVNLEHAHVWLSSEFLTPARCFPLTCQSDEYYISAGELLFIVPDGGPVQFITGDRPQEFFGTEVCLVRNHRFHGIYFLRTNGIVGREVMHMIAENLAASCPIAERNRIYLLNKSYFVERIIGRDCGLVVGCTEKPYSPMLSHMGLAFYHKSMLVFTSPQAMTTARLGSMSMYPAGFPLVEYTSDS